MAKECWIDFSKWAVCEIKITLQAYTKQHRKGMVIISVALLCSLKSYDRNVIVFWFANEITKHSRDKLRPTHSSCAGEPRTACIAGSLWYFPFRLSPGQVRNTKAGLLQEGSKKSIHLEKQSHLPNPPIIFHPPHTLCHFLYYCSWLENTGPH